MNFQPFLKKAQENLAAAEACFDLGYYNVSATRSYFAMFQAAVALLIYKDYLPVGKMISHKWVQATVSQRLIKQQKLLPRQCASYLSEAQEIRNRSDYGLIEISKAVNQKQIKRAQSFLGIVRKELPDVPES